MSFHPESQVGFVDDLKCPYCKSDEVEYIGDEVQTMHGVCDTHEVVEGQCCDCGKKQSLRDAI